MTKRENKLRMTNQNIGSILGHLLLAFVALFINGFGVFLTIHASIGAGPWDVLNIGISETLHILYGTASIAVSITILGIDILLREPIGLAMIIDAFTVGKAVDFFDWTGWVPVPSNLFGSIVMLIAGLIIIAYTQVLYMWAALGCGPRDTLLVGCSRKIKKIPLGVIGICIQGIATLIGYLLGGPVGIGTILNVLCAGPILQFAFFTCRFKATDIQHQNIKESFKVFFKKKKTTE